MNYFQTFKGFFRKEMLQTLRDPRMRFLLFVAPIVQLTIFGIALSNDVKNVTLAVMAKPRDQELRHVYDHAIASGFFKAAKVTGVDPFQWIASGQADAVLVSSPTGPVQLLIDSKNIVKARAIENYIQAIATQVIGKKAMAGYQFKVRALYNPSMRTAIYMVPGVMCILICLITVILSSMAITKEREMGTLETLIAAPVHGWEILLGKTFPFIILGFVQAQIILLVAIFGFQIPLRGSLILLEISVIIFVFSTVSIGTLISTLAKSQQQSMMGGFIFLFPGVLLSGLLFPVESMPILLKIVAWCNPLTHFIALNRNLMVKGTSFEFYLIHAFPLLCLATVCATIALRKFKTVL